MLIVKIDYESARNIAFTVKNTDKKTKYSVIYKKDKKEWSCNCKWNTLKETPCSHIREAQRFLENMIIKDLIV